MRPRIGATSKRAEFFQSRSSMGRASAHEDPALSALVSPIKRHLTRSPPHPKTHMQQKTGSTGRQARQAKEQNSRSGWVSPPGHVFVDVRVVRAEEAHCRNWVMDMDSVGRLPEAERISIRFGPHPRICHLDPSFTDTWLLLAKGLWPRVVGASSSDRSLV